MIVSHLCLLFSSFLWIDLNIFSVTGYLCLFLCVLKWNEYWEGGGTDCWSDDYFRTSSWNRAMLVTGLWVMKARRGKGGAMALSTPELALPAVSQATYWERGNLSAVMGGNLAVCQVPLFVVLWTGQIGFPCTWNRAPNHGHSRAAHTTPTVSVNTMSITITTIKTVHLRKYNCLQQIQKIYCIFIRYQIYLDLLKK